jgi:hypothetical protein
MSAAVFTPVLPARSSNAGGSPAAVGTVISEDGQRCRQRVPRPTAGLADDLGLAGEAGGEDGFGVGNLDADELVAAPVKRDERAEARGAAALVMV